MNYTLLQIQISEGNKKALKSLYELFYEKLYSISLKYLRNEEDAKEVVADVFIKIWKLRKELPSIKNLDAYLFKILRNMCFDVLKKSYNKQVYLSVETNQPKDWDTHSLDPASQLIEQELLEIMEKTLANLPSRQYQAFQLLRIEGFSYKQVSEEMGISVSAVEKLISKATKKLASVLPNELRSNNIGGVKEVTLILAVLFFI